MPHTITCPTPDCGRQLRVPDTLVGKKVKCPSCGNTFVAQVDEPPPPPEEPEERDERQEQQEEERPVRRKIAREDDEEDDDRPRKRRRRGYMKEHRGTVILVLGILGIVLGCPFGLIMGPIAWSMANADLPEIRSGRMDPSGEGTTNAGRICGIIATILNGIGAVCCVGYILILIIAGAAGGIK